MAHLAILTFRQELNPKKINLLLIYKLQSYYITIIDIQI